MLTKEAKDLLQLTDNSHMWHRALPTVANIFKGLKPSLTASADDLIPAYYPEFEKAPSDHPSYVKYNTNFNDLYKSSYVNKDIAQQALTKSQQARRRNPVSRHIPLHKNLLMSHWSGGDRSSASYIKSHIAPDNISIIGWDGELPYKGGDIFKFLGSSNNPDKVFKNKNERERAMYNLFHGAHASYNQDTEDTGIIFTPRTNTNNDLRVGGIKDSSTSHSLGHELQHPVTFSAPSANAWSVTQLAGVTPRTTRNFYSLRNDERNRAYHSMKAMASDLAGKYIDNYNDAVNTLVDNNILKRPPISTNLLSGLQAYKVDLPRYEALVRTGKIKPTDVSMIEDVIDLNERMGNPIYNKEFMDIINEHGIHPYDDLPFKDIMKQQKDSKGNPLKPGTDEYNRKLWNMIRNYEFEEANNTPHPYTSKIQYS